MITRCCDAAKRTVRYSNGWHFITQRTCGQEDMHTVIRRVQAAHDNSQDGAISKNNRRSVLRFCTLWTRRVAFDTPSCFNHHHDKIKLCLAERKSSTEACTPSLDPGIVTYHSLILSELFRLDRYFSTILTHRIKQEHRCSGIPRCA